MGGEDGGSMGSRWALPSLSMSILLSALGTSIANVGLPAMADGLAVPFGQVQWVVLAYLLAVTTLIVGAGRLGDMVGRRRLLLIGMGLFTIASTLCGLAPTLALLVAARGLQGAGAAIMMAMSMALVGGTVDKARTGRAMGMLGSMSAVGTALGPSLGGMIIGAAGWHGLFLVNVPLGLAALVMVRRHVPDDGRGTADARGFDLVGTVLLATALAAYALAMSVGRADGSGIALLTASVLLVGLFVLWQGRTPDPLLRLSLFGDAGLCMALAANLLVSAVMMAMLVAGPFYLMRAFGLAPAAAGLALTLGPCVSAVAGLVSGRAVDRFGPARMVPTGLAGVAAGGLLLAAIGTRWGLPGYLAPIALMTSGYALFQAANNTDVMGGLAAERRGLVSGLLNLSRNLGLITGAAALGPVFALATGTSDMTATAPDMVETGIRAAFLVSGLLVGTATIALGVRSPQPGNPSPPGSG
ncbi:MFS transporter [Niveispirillum sp. KHB5.9]|uniref:MFS transporter n=1 Tax=Niveispirillum sp. KHB5.9 TaxID=3400269 RepID=UPI003A8C3F54